MKIVFYLSHPAHFHLCRHTILTLARTGKEVRVLYNDKDVLGALIADSGLKDFSERIRTVKKVSSPFMLRVQFAQKALGLAWKLLRYRPDVVAGTSVLISLLGRLLRFRSVILNEDDFDVIRKTADLGYPKADHILCPWPCRTGAYDDKCLKYHSYHELAYLHPDLFNPDKEVVRSYFSPDEPYYLIRFARLTAHHDVGITGIDAGLARELIRTLEPHGRVFITSERDLEPEFESYRIAIRPRDIHHVMAFASLFIGDSQTMAAEAAVLGTPFVRFNGFVGRLSYLDELETGYGLGRGIPVHEPERLLDTIRDMVSDPGLKAESGRRREIMLTEKVNLAAQLIWFFSNYPASVTGWESASPPDATSRVINGVRVREGEEESARLNR